MKILLTGSTGFIGCALHSRLSAQPELSVFGAGKQAPAHERYNCVGEINGNTDWVSALQDIQVVVHLAARAHVLTAEARDKTALFRETNVDGTLNLARQAAAAGVKRFIFISSIGVNGAQTHGEAFDESASPAPQAAYAISKYQAEQGLLELCKGAAMELVIIRPPLVYGGAAPGNFQRLLKLVASGLPLPFASVNNQRSLLALENLLDFIACCITHPAAANQLFLPSDGEAPSTAQMMRYLAQGMGRKPRLFAFPVGLLRWCGGLLGRRVQFDQLCGSLLVDSSKSRDLLGWQPVVSTQQALLKAGREYQASRAHGSS